MFLSFYTFIVAAAVIVGLAALFRNSFFIFKSLDASRKNLFYLVCAYYFIFFIILWPGLLDGDLTYVLTDVRRGNIHEFQGRYFSAYINIWERLGVQFFFPAAVQIILLLYCGLVNLSFLKNIRKPRLALVVWTFIFFSPLTVGITLFNSRDSLLALAFSAFFLFIYKNYIFQKKPASKSVMFALGALLFLICQIRQEAVLIFFLAPLAAGAFKLVLPKTAGLVLLVGILGWGLVHVLPENTLGLRQSWAHQTTAVLNPLNEILFKTGADLDAEDRTILDRVIDVECFQKTHDQYDIDPFHRGCYRRFGSEIVKPFLVTSAKLFFKHWRIVLENRIKVFLKAGNITESANSIFLDAYHRTNWDTLRANTEPLQAEYEKSFKYQVYHHLIGLVVIENWPIRIMLFSLIPCLVLMAMILITGPISFKMVVSLLLIRCLAVLALAPAAYFKYYHVLYIFSIAVVLVWVSSKSEKVESQL